MTIYWNFSTISAGQIQDHLNNPEYDLSGEELAIFHKFTIPKRKQEWLASRFLVKQLVVLCQDSGIFLSPCSIAVRNMSNGVPYVTLNGSGRIGWLSLSHSMDGVLVGYSPDISERFGVDLEFIEERSPQLISDFFTASESRWLETLHGEEKKVLANVIWSAKEAYLKAIEKGLNLDTRRVEIKQIGRCWNHTQWCDVHFQADDRDTRDWRIFFKREGNYILTMCLSARENVRVERIAIDFEKSLHRLSTAREEIASPFAVA